MSLEAKNTSYRYPHGRVVLEHFSLTVEKNERVIISAPSGTGKTTLCRILAGYIEPQTGEVLVDGVPLPKKGPSPVQLISQHPETTLDPRLRMKESLKEALDIDWKQSELLQSLGIRQEWLERYPHELSGGELQRFCIARALASRPKYLICDEISTMLDAVTQALIWHFLIDYAKVHEVGLVAVTHSVALAKRIATRTVLLDDLSAQ